MVDETEQLTVLFNFHDVVKDSLNFAIRSAVDPADIEVDDLNYIAMPGFVGHADFVEKHFEDFLFIATLALSFLYFLVHDFDGDSLVSLQIDSHLDSWLGSKYLLKRPVPSLKTTRYF